MQDSIEDEIRNLAANFQQMMQQMQILTQQGIPLQAQPPAPPAQAQLPVPAMLISKSPDCLLLRFTGNNSVRGYVEDFKLIAADLDWNEQAFRA
ncbi:hypothetical protein NXF25_008567 [Crotalus adamanteus]|uniref:Uncharacterized protein n=1 Tax=Crotalus adamanteus TaxID=8729 RepID=A0AAW1BPQ0_CROAD